MGFYRFVDRTESLDITRKAGIDYDDRFILTYPETMLSQNANVTSYLAVHYLDEPEDQYVTYVSKQPGEDPVDEVLRDSAPKILSYYGFQYETGHFSMLKTSPYEVYSKGDYRMNQGRPPVYSSRFLSKKLYSGDRVTFTLSGTYHVETSASDRSSSSGAATTTQLLSENAPASPISTSENDGEVEGGGNIHLGTVFDMVLGDDRITVLKNSGFFRMMESSEYRFSRISIPADKDPHEYDIYVSNIGYTTASGTTAPWSSYRLYRSGQTNATPIYDLSQIASEPGFSDFTDGVKAYYIKVRHVVSDYTLTARVDASFSVNAQQLRLPENEQIDPQGYLTNIGYLRVFTEDDPGHNILSTTDSSFIGDFGAQLKSLDRAAFSDELQHHCASAVYLRDITTKISSGTTIVDEPRTMENGGGYAVNIRTTGTIQTEKTGGEDTPGELEKFSLYVRIPPLVTFDTTLSGLSLANCYGRDTIGRPVTLADFQSHVSYRLIELNNGERLIAADFDFSDNPLEISSMTSLQLNVPAEILYTDFKTSPRKSYEIDSYTMLRDEGIGQVVPIQQQANTNIPEFVGKTVASSKDTRNYESKAEEWENTAQKFVKSHRDEAWKFQYQVSGGVGAFVSETTVNAYNTNFDRNSEVNKRAEYAYRLSVTIGSFSSDFVIADVLETEPDGEWQGTLQSVDCSYAASLGLIPTLYYSSSPVEYNDETRDMSLYQAATAQQWNGSVWTPPDETVRSIVVLLDTSQLDNQAITKKQVYVLANMLAPENPEEPENSLLGKYAVNKTNVYFTSTMTDTRVSLPTNISKIKLLPTVLLVSLMKLDEKTNAPLSDISGEGETAAVFSFFTDPACTQPAVDWLGNPTAQNIRVNRLGQLNVDTLEPGTYYYKEVAAPAGYRLDTTVHKIVLTNKDVIYDPDKTIAQNAADTECAEDGLVIYNERLTGTIIFTKKDADDPSVTGLKNAVYALYDANGVSVYTDHENHYQETGGTKTTFTTDPTGKITISGLPWGNYYLEELTAPDGYELNPEKVWVHVGKNLTPEEQQADTIYVYCSQGDKEKTASLRLMKYDLSTNQPLGDAWFALEKKDGEAWQTVPGYEYLKSGKNGAVLAENLNFGTYRFSELVAPAGYRIDNQASCSEEVTLDMTTIGSTLTVEMYNERIRGKVTLRKLSDDGIPLNNAVFDLYRVNGEIDPQGKIKSGDTVTDYGGRQAGDPDDVKIRMNMVTKRVGGQDGMLETIEGLEWGAYYFKEFSSPSGYESENTLYYFEINAQNADTIIDSIRAVNNRKKGEVILNKLAGSPVTAEGVTYAEGDGIPNAEFSLFTTAGDPVYVKPKTKTVTDPATNLQTQVECFTVCSSEEPGAVSKMKTNSDGQLRVDELTWGGYNFEEVKAPTGFSLADKVRFTVNATNCLSSQELECYDEPVECLIQIDKVIDDKLDVFGTPTFVFRITKTDAPTQDFTRMVTLAGDTKAASVRLQVPVGTYRVEEVKVNRYHLTNAVYVFRDGEGDDTLDTNAGQLRIDGEAVTREHQPQGGKVFTFTLSADEHDNPQTAHLKFENNLKNYSGLGHTSAVDNIVPSKRKITGFSLEYVGSEFIECDEDNTPYLIPATDLKGYITYGDGAVEPMTAEQMALVLPNQFTVDNSPANAGQSFMFTAKYTPSEGSRTFRTNFLVTVGPYNVVESQKVIFHTDVNNRSVFTIDGMRYGVNTVYYNDNEDGTAKTNVSGKYVQPEVVTGMGLMSKWEIMNGEDAGLQLSANEETIKQYLMRHYVDGLRELELRAVLSDNSVEFEQTDQIQTFVAPKTGIYFLEGWGAQGGTAYDPDDPNKYGEGGKGGYSYGYVYLLEGQEVYIGVGGAGMDNDRQTGESVVADPSLSIAGGFVLDGGYNGGGRSKTNPKTAIFASGGGATHFAVGNNLGELQNYSSNAQQPNILLVAGGGGGGSRAYLSPNDVYQGGYGGGETGGTGEAYQSDHGGGGGLYGGSGGQYGGCSGGGGSGYVNPNLTVGSDKATFDGSTNFPSPTDSSAAEVGHSGNGYARITYLDS